MPQSKGTILYIGGFELPDKNAAAHRVLNNAKAFSAIGYNVVFFGIDKTLEWGNTPTKSIVSGFDAYATPYPSGVKKWISEYFNSKTVIDIIKSHTDTVAVVAYNLKAYQFMRIIRYCKKFGIKVISDCTEWYDATASGGLINIACIIDSFVRMRFINKKVDGMIAISRYLENHYYSALKSVITVPPLVDVSEEKWQQDCINNSDKVHFVYSGDPTGKDRLGKIIECFADADSPEKFCFEIIGVSKEEFLACYPELSGKLNRLNGSVVFHGRVSHKESLKILKSADYSIFVRDKSRKNMAGFPTKFVESYTAGVHIIANDVSDIREYFPKDKYSVLAVDGSFERIKAAICKALSFGPSELRENKRSADKNPFDYHMWIDSFETFFKGLD